MGKRIISQRRGKGSPRYVTPKHRYKGAAKHRPLTKDGSYQGKVIGLVHCPAHSSPLAIIRYSDGKESLTIAPETMAIGATLSSDPDNLVIGDLVELENIQEGTLIFNIEKNPGDGGKFIRASGTFGKIVGKTSTGITIQMPSKKQMTFNPKCRASIGTVAGGGRVDKPFLKAGNLHYKKKAQNKLYPSVSGHSMNAVDHPFGNSRSSRKSKSRPTSRHAPPGRKVGSIGARRTGRRKK